MKKQFWLDLAEVIDAFRLWPRFMLALFWVFMWDVHGWYTTAAANGVGSDFYANLVFGSISALTGFYMGTGRRWA